MHDHIPLIEDKALYDALADSYSVDLLFSQACNVALKAQPINRPVEYQGNYYVSLSGCCTPTTERNGIRGCDWQEWGHRLHRPEDWQGEIKSGMLYSWQMREYKGLLVVDPDGREWVVGDMELRALWFEPDERIEFRIPALVERETVEYVPKGQMTFL